MRTSLRVAVLVSVLVSACSAKTPEAPAGLTNVNLCYSAPTTTQAVPWYALEKGIFEKYGLHVNLLRVQGGSQAVTTLITGDADLCQSAGNSVVNAAAAGQDVVLIAGIYNTYPAILVAKPEIKSLEELKGKKVGTGLTASASDVATQLALSHLGLDPALDVVTVQIGEEPERVAAFQAGEIDAVLTSAPYLHILRQGGVSELLDFGKLGIPYAHTGILTTRKYIAENRETTVKFMKAIVAAIAAMKADPNGTQAVLAKYLELDPVKNAPDLKDAYESTILPMIQEQPYPNLEGLQTLIDYTAQSNPGAAGLQPADLVDTSIMDELQQSGFFEEVRKSP